MKTPKTRPQLVVLMLLLFLAVTMLAPSAVLAVLRERELSEPFSSDNGMSCGTMASYWAIGYLGYTATPNQWEYLIDLTEGSLGHSNHDWGHCPYAIELTIRNNTNYDFQQHLTSNKKDASYYCIDDNHCTLTYLDVDSTGHVFTSHGYYDNTNYDVFYYCSNETWIRHTTSYDNCSYPGYGYYDEVYD